MNVVRWTLGLVAIGWGAVVAHAESPVQTAFDYTLVCHECCEPTCGCEEPCCDEACCSDACEDPGCCEDPCCGDECCGDSCCGDSCCGCDSGCGLCECDLGDAWTLKGALDPCDECGIDFGGWTQLGYHSDNTRLSTTFGDVLAFNDVPDQLNLHQQWLWFEKVAEAPCCGVDWGFRFDLMYGTDAQKTQAFGNDPGEWDFLNGFDHGEYGWALPQLYGELAWGDWSVIAGHFYTLIGYEVVTAPDNFFYSHAYTMFNSEPFTHTGALATYSGAENVELYMGWTLGWDTGFDQSNGGSSWLGGFSTSLTDEIDFTYISTAGNFGARTSGESGYSHSLVFDCTLSDNLNYVFQSDLVQYDDQGNGGGNQGGINQYLFYTVNDCLAAGLRVEWWKSDGVVAANDSASFYGVTYGLNYRPHANLVIRPEVRHNWTPARDAYLANNGVDFNQTVFGIDAVLTY